MTVCVCKQPTAKSRIASARRQGGDGSWPAANVKDAPGRHPNGRKQDEAGIDVEPGALHCGGPWIGSAVAQTTGAAPQCCGLPPIYDSPQKSMVGTAVNSMPFDRLFHRLRGQCFRSLLSDRRYVSDREHGIPGRRRREHLRRRGEAAELTVTQPDPRSMRWQAVTGNAGHNWQITKSIFADPSNNTLIQEDDLSGAER